MKQLMTQEMIAATPPALALAKAKANYNALVAEAAEWLDFHVPDLDPFNMAFPTPEFQELFEVLDSLDEPDDQIHFPYIGQPLTKLSKAARKYETLSKRIREAIDKTLNGGTTNR